MEISLCPLSSSSSHGARTSACLSCNDTLISLKWLNNFASNHHRGNIDTYYRHSSHPSRSPLSCNVLIVLQQNMQCCPENSFWYTFSESLQCVYLFLYLRDDVKLTSINHVKNRKNSINITRRKYSAVEIFLAASMLWWIGIVPSMTANNTNRMRLLSNIFISYFY